MTEDPPPPDAPAVQTAGPGLARNDPADRDPAAGMEEFIYIITHDLRASFRAFHTIPEWIREDMGPLPPEREAIVAEHLDLLTTQAARADRMLLDLRDFSRIGRLADPIGAHPLEEVLDRASQISPFPDRASLQVTGSATLTGPGNELAMLFAALLSNAVKHHDRDQVRIRLSLADDGPLLRLTLDDDGPGIPTRFREAVFAPLRTLRPRDQCEGSGMGLAIARKIVTRLGGEIHIAPPEDADPEGPRPAKATVETVVDQATAPPRGTRVVFTLPGQMEDPPPPRLN
ncbi:sensor histidine kinase [Pseudooceanicola marinus]|uniref:sensor histidine kinase n=1 Tax=Pseudooceanicola marinus TaxID=396013 RepID=UPI001CD1ABBF|nr:HAMP domain-containing sensor histidine kinase [Pseudooceanicola marinus]MCA1337140.1 HAMP domain-containing histidine kinase [Pseudooceanicola marinus]